MFLSSNCLWGENLGRPVDEERAPAPIELYGRSKLEGERILKGFMGDLDVVIIRCPTIMDGGRLGLLAILYEFIDDGKTVWVVGMGATGTSSSTRTIWRRRAFRPRGTDDRIFSTSAPTT